MPVLAIDFGTTTTVAAVRGDTGPPRLVAVDGSPLLPSSVFLSASGTLTVGRDADRESRLDPGRYEPNPKRRIDDGEVLLGRSVLPVVELVAAVLHRVATEVGRQFGGLPADIRLTHPARWGRARRRLLLDAAAVAGLGADPTLIPEPVAAATHYGSLARALAPDAGVAVYDLGGGTFDVAVLRNAGGSRWTVVAEAGLPDLGGVDFDQAIIEHIAGQQAASAPAGWRALLTPTDAAGRRLRRAFENDVRDCKESLSRFTQAEVPLPAPFHDALLTRTGFEELIRAQLVRSVDLLTEQLTRSGVPAGSLAGVYLVGGSSRIPLVARLIQERLGITSTTLDQPETSVATGALLVPVAPAPAPPPAVLDPPPAPPRQPNVAPPDPTRDRWAAPVRPQRRLPAWLLPAAVAVVVLGVLASVLLISRGGKQDDTASAPRSSSPGPTSTTPSPPPSRSSSRTGAAPNARTRYDPYFPDAQVRAYARPVYPLLSGCEPADKYGVTLCRLDNGLTVELGSDTSQGRYDSRRNSTLATGSRSWAEKRWSRGGAAGLLRTWLRTDRPTLPLLYWDRNNTVWGIMGIGAKSVTTTSASAVRLVWQQQFDR